jgi:hypothetical protein
MSIGTCLCGLVEFEVAPPYRWSAHCHCSICRRHHGSLFSTSLGVAAQRFRWLRGADAIVSFRATPAFERPFCRACGSKLPGLSQWSELVNVPAGTVEPQAGDRLEPRSHIFAGSRSPHCEIRDELPQFDAYPPSDAFRALASNASSSAAPASEPHAFIASHGATLASVSAAPAAAPEIFGACLCGIVGYCVEGRLACLVDCRCLHCRRSRGAAYATNAYVAASRFRFTRGAEAVRQYAPAASEAWVGHCAYCGSLLPSRLRGHDIVVLPAGSLDARSANTLFAPGVPHLSDNSGRDGVCSNAFAAAFASEPA